MHGRLKVKSTAEQLEAKKKEREKKLQLYNAATSKIFNKKKAGELDEELLAVTGEVLAVNPDFYTLWNFRKETFLELQNTKSKDELQKLFQSELYFLDSCLKVSPKSYGTWHHRCFVLDSMPEPDWSRELQLCNKFLMHDERNFHCWDYRRFVVKRSGIPPDAELEFSMSKISNNFSNYSSWHYRSKLLPILYPDPAQPMGVSEGTLLKEYELVQNGFFTDPDDQSNWFYHRWLMGRAEQKQEISFLSVSKVDRRAILTFAKHIKIGKNTQLVLQINDSVLDVKWHNEGRNTFYSTMWIGDDINFSENEDQNIKVTLQDNNTDVCSCLLHFAIDEKSAFSFYVDNSSSSRFSQELSAMKSETLQQELESVSQLMEIETDNKWAVLTAVLLMKALDPVKYRVEIMNNIGKLEILDFKRINYYRDLRSKFIMENIIDATDPSTATTLSLNEQGLTKMHHPELLPLVATLNLSNNQLKDVHNFSYLQNLVDLRLSGNKIENCEGLQHLPKLERVALNNNCLSSVESLCPLQSCPRLKLIDLSGNPLCESEVILEGVKELLPGIEIVIKQSS